MVTARALALRNKPRTIRQPVDDGNRTTLKGNTRREANAKNDRGLVPDDMLMEHLLLQLRRSPEQEQALEEFLDQVHSPSSPTFHQWLSASDFGNRFGLADEDLNAITAWLQSHDLTVNVVYPNGTVIDFSGTAAQVRKAFHTEIHNLEVNGKKHIANLNDPEIPAALASAVVGIVSLNDFRPKPMRQSRANYTFSSGGIDEQAVVPADLATIYNLNPLFTGGYSGQGQTIVAIEDTNLYSTSDWTTFRSKFGLSQYSSGSLTTVHPASPSGTNNCANPGVVPGNDGEAILDAEWASAAAPSAAIEVAACADTVTTFGGLIALQNLINASGAPPAIMSISYGECEAVNGAAANAAYRTAYQQAVAEGVSVFVASGDSGAAGCDNSAAEATHGIGVNAFASTPYNVAVGGTDFGDTYAGTNSNYWNTGNISTYGSAKSYIPEIPWNDSCASQLVASYVTGSSTTYGPERILQHRYRLAVPGHGGRRWRTEWLRYRGALQQWRREWVLQGIPAALVAVGAYRGPQQRCTQHSGRFAVRRRQSVGTLLRLLLVGPSNGRASMHRRSQQLGWCWRDVLFVAHYGRHPGSGEPEDREPPRQPQLRLLRLGGR